MIPDTQQTSEGSASTNAFAPSAAQPIEVNRKSARKTAGTKPRPTSRQPSVKSPTKPASKQDKVLSLLRRKEGVSIAAIMKATGWQKHSVHGFLAGVVRKKLGLNLQSADTDGKRIYRVVAGKASKKATAKRKRGR